MDICSEALKKVKSCCGSNCECEEMNLLQESLKCAEINFETCNNDLDELGNLVGGSCYDHTYDLVKALVNKPTFTQSDLYELSRVIKIAEVYDLVNSCTSKELLKKIEEMEEEYEKNIY